MKIWLDDERPAPAGWKHVEDAWKAIFYLSEYPNQIEVISLDHDLGNEELYGNGYTVMKWLEEQVFEDPSFPVPEVKFHTANPLGRINMQRALDSIVRFKNAIPNESDSA
jgi:hypothetical protein